MSTVRCAIRGILRSRCYKSSNSSHNVRNFASSVEKGSSSTLPYIAIGTSIAAATVLATGYFGSTALAQSPKQDPHLSIEKPPDVWDRWDQVKNFLFSWRKSIRGGGGGGGGAEVPVPTDKLACHLSVAQSGTTRPIILVSCGSFNPPTTMHVRMLELARQELFSRGYDVLGAYISPVNDAYWKRDLAPGRHRVQMCHEATADSDFIMVDAWEVEQQQYTRTLRVLEHLEKRLCQLFQPTNTDDRNTGTTPSSTTEGEAVSVFPKDCPPTLLQPRTMLVCGADVVESMANESLWKQDLLEIVLKKHGVVCITRDGAGANASRLFSQPGTLLYQYRENVILVQDPVPNEISSSSVRRELKEGRSVKYLLAPAVEEYIRKHGLYGSGARKKMV